MTITKPYIIVISIGLMIVAILAAYQHGRQDGFNLGYTYDFSDFGQGSDFRWGHEYILQ